MRNAGTLSPGGKKWNSLCQSSLRSLAHLHLRLSPSTDIEPPNIDQSVPIALLKHSMVQVQSISKVAREVSIQSRVFKSNRISLDNKKILHNNLLTIAQRPTWAKTKVSKEPVLAEKLGTLNPSLVCADRATSITYRFHLTKQASVTLEES